MPKKISHFGLHDVESGKPVALNANAGDTLLFQATRDLFTKFLGPIDWKLEALWKEVTEKDIQELNKNSDAVLVGGGGLLLRDQKGADTTNSGWQWNCSSERINELTVPLIIFGIGYNRFRNQPDFDPVFSENIKTIVEKSKFFGLRNHGSRRAIMRYLPDSLHHLVRYQPCPTTLAWYLYENLIEPVASAKKGKTLALNAAFDRGGLRFNNREEQICKDITKVMKNCVQDGWRIVIVNHKPQDAGISRFLEAEGVSFESVNLEGVYPEEIMKFYLGVDLTVGMRGHAQMIPFGLRKPIVSIISHDKMKWFLDDIAHPEWGVDIEDPSFAQNLYKTIKRVSDNPNIVNEIAIAQEHLWSVTSANMEEIKEQI